MGGRTNQVTHKCLGRNLSPSNYGWKDEPSHSRVPWSKFKSSYLRVGGRTKSLTNALIQNLKSYYLRMEGRTKPPASALVQNLGPSTYGWKDEPSHLQVPWSKFKVLLPTSERTNQVTNNCLGNKFKSFYVWVEGRTKSLTSDSV